MSNDISRRKTLTLFGGVAGALTVSGVAASTSDGSSSSTREMASSSAQLDSQLEWRRTHDTAGSAVGNDVVVLEDGFAYAGTVTTDEDGSDAYLVETDETGAPRWRTSFGGAGEQIVTGLVAVEEGYVLCGSGDTGFFVRIDDQGAETWRTDVGLAVNDLSITADGGYVIAGKKDATEGGATPLLGKVAADGSVEWTRTYERGTPSYFNAVVQTPDGGYALAGYANLDAYWTLKTDGEGNRMWSTAPREGEAVDVSLTTDGDILCTGAVRGDGGFSPYLTRFEPDGTVRSSTQYDDIDASRATSVQQLPNGEIVLSTDWFGLLVTDGDGTKQLFRAYNGNATALAGLGDGRVVVTGRTEGEDADSMLAKTYSLTTRSDTPTASPTADGEPAADESPTESAASSTPTTETSTPTTTDSGSTDNDCTI